MRLKRALTSLISIAALSVAILHGCWEVSPAYAADVQLGTGGTYRTLASGVSWANANHTWIISPVNQNESACLYFTNFNQSSSHTFTLAVKQTGDPYVADYTNNTAEWVPAVINGSASPIAASSSVQVSASLSGAAKFAVIVSGAASASGSPDTFNLLVIQGAPCAAPNTWTLSSAPAAGTQAQATQAGIPGVRHVAQTMSASIAQTSTTAARGEVIIYDGACGTNPVFEIWIVVAGTANTAQQFGQNSLGIVGTAGNAMCITFNAGATGVLESVSLSGYDTQ